MHKIDLHIFTNCTEVIDKKQTIFKTFESFVATFGYIKPTIWLDLNPCTDEIKIKNYIKLIKTNIDCNLKIVKSLSEGYIKAIKLSQNKFLFMLEHDWVFFKDNIQHSLNDICEEINFLKISHLRFNRINNNVSHSMKEYNCIEEIYGNKIVFSSTNSASNNPHILNLPIYNKICLSKIKEQKGSFGIEQELINTKLNFAVYGNLHNLATIGHLDGRKL